MGHYYSNLVYEDLMRYPIKSKIYREGVMAVTVADFKKSAIIQVEYYGKDNTEYHHLAWIVLASFCETRYIDDAMYLRSVEADRIVKILPVRKPNVKFVRMLHVDTRNE